MLPAGKKLGKYEVVRLLGSGGMADVYEAEDNSLGRRVALKILPPELARNAQLVSRFESEVRKAASLNHGGIVPVFDFGVDDGMLFYSMRLLTGGNLSDRISAGLSDLEALEILRQVAGALGHAHRRPLQPLIHRDVKPANILFDEQGHAVLTDFGIAKAMDSAVGLTATGTSIGTAHYMSPEQARGRKDIDHRADIYSLGAVLFEMLTGRPPYDSEEQISLILQHVTEPIPRLPPEYAQYQPIVDRMMAKAPADRPADTDEVIALVDAMINPLKPAASTRTARGEGPRSPRTTASPAPAVSVESFSSEAAPVSLETVAFSPPSVERPPVESPVTADATPDAIVEPMLTVAAQQDAGIRARQSEEARRQKIEAEPWLKTNVFSGYEKLLGEPQVVAPHPVAPSRWKLYAAIAGILVLAAVAVLSLMSGRHPAAPGEPAQTATPSTEPGELAPPTSPPAASTPSPTILPSATPSKPIPTAPVSERPNAPASSAAATRAVATPSSKSSAKASIPSPSPATGQTPPSTPAVTTPTKTDIDSPVVKPPAEPVAETPQPIAPQADAVAPPPPIVATPPLQATQPPPVSTPATTPGDGPLGIFERAKAEAKRKAELQKVEAQKGQDDSKP